MWTTRSRFAALLLGGIAVAAADSAAQCPDLSRGTEYKVLVDEIAFDAPEAVKPAVSLDFIQSSVEGALEKVRQGILKGSSSKGTILYLNCPGRHPNKTEFRDDFIRSMAANHAILEFWGTLFVLGGGQNKFEIHYVMFPVGLEAQPRPSEFAVTEKIVTGKPSPEQVKQYFVTTRADLPAYFTISAGLQAYADRQWDQAVRFLCEARTRLKNKPDEQDLMTFADSIANKAGAELRKSNLATGASLMTDTQAKDYCTFATTR